MRSLFAFLFSAVAFAQTFTVQQSNTNASLRGVWAVSDKNVWASGTRGTFLKTLDGGATWTAGTVAGAEALDFRDVQGVDENTAYLLSIGDKDASRVYKTTDGGAHWELLFEESRRAQGLLRRNGLLEPHARPSGGRPSGGPDRGDDHRRRRQNLAAPQLPTALQGEGPYSPPGAAQGITVLGKRAGVDRHRRKGCRAGILFRGRSGRTWTVSPTPVRADSAAAGIFSLAFSDAKHGVAVGGDL